MCDRHLSRRGIVKLFATFTAASIWPGERWSASVLAEALPEPSDDGGWLIIQLSDFPTLEKEFGSVRLGTSRVGANHRPAGLFYPVIINRATEGKFHALEAACTHEGCTVPIFDAQARWMECPCHGSRYALDGRVIRGPANFGLRSYDTQFDGVNRLRVALPDTVFALKALQVKPKAARVELEFIAFEEIEYEVRKRANLDEPWKGPVPFSLTAEGPLDQTFLVGQANFARVYLPVSSPTELYAVVMRVKAV